MSTTYRKPIDLSDKKKMLLKQLLQKEAAASQSQQRQASADTRPVLSPRTDRASYPLSLAQKQIWLREQFAPATALTAVLSFKGEVQLDLLQESLQTLVERHEILRATFIKQPDQAVQIRLTDIPVTISLQAAEESQTLTDLLREQPAASFDLARGPLFQASLLQRDKDEQIFLLSMHPLLADSDSLDLCCQELVRLYQDALTGQSTAQPANSLSYADYAHWQQDYLQGARLQEELTYWQQQLTDAHLSLNLPYDHARTSQTLIRPDQATLELSSELTQAAHAFCQQQDLPLDHLLFSILTLLLHRYTSQTEIVCGFLAPHRSPELTTIIGNFATQLPIRVQLAEGLSAHKIVKQIHRTLDTARQHAELPLEQIVAAVDPQHDLTRLPYFQTSFAFHQHPALARDTVHSYPALPEEFLQDLAFVFHASERRLTFSVAYDSHLFDQSSIERLQAHYSQLLQSFLQQPEQAFSELSCLTQDEREAILHTWNESHLAEPLARAEGLHHLFERQVQRTPKAIALSDGEQQLSYQQLNQRANQLAHLLRRRGVEPEQLVGLCHSRSLDLVVSVFAILKAGAAYMPLDPSYPSERLAYTIQDARPVLILTQQDLLAQMPFAPEQALCLDTPGLYEQESTENLNIEMHYEQLAYIIYTSGSTGRPKGVCISHRSAQAFLRWSRQQFSDEELSGVLFGTSICFDLSIFEIFAPLSWGGKTILATSVLDLPQLAQREHITLLNTVPSAATALLNTHDLPRSLLTINLAGEALTRDLVQALYDRTNIQRVCNLYGPTEDTTYSTETTLSPQEMGAVSIGRPLANTQAYILDAQMQPVPIGIIGELYLGGDGQAHGYLNHPRLTAERFVSDPFSSISGRRLYKTGDLVRYRPDGNIDYLGRSDHQVKIRGFRIELGEIESQLRLHPAIADVVVSAIEEAPGNKQLVAYIVIRAHMEYDSAQIRQYLQDLLPTYMIPTFFIPLERLPQTLNGKVDRKALPGPSTAKFRLSLAPNTLPRGKQEQWLAQLWQEILLVPALGRHDNFFSLGGNSLDAFRLLARIKRDFQKSLAVEDLFANPTVAQLADKLQSTSIQTDLEPIAFVHNRASSPETPLPLSFVQQRIWFDDQLEHARSMFNVPLVFTLNGTLNRLALHQALHEIIRRHEPLRTTIRISKGNPFQFINDHITPAFTFTDLSDLAETAENASEESIYSAPYVLREIQQEVQSPFDIARGPLLRIRLLRLQANQHVLLLTMHQIITDGWSLSVIATELGLLYNAFRSGRPSPLPELPIRYTDFVAWQREHQAKQFAADLAYWKACLTPLPPTLALPTDYVRPLIQTFAGSSLQFQLTPQLTQQLIKVSQEQEVTLFITLLTAFFVLLARYSGQEDLVVGTSVANRFHPELETLVGFFVNDLALRADLSGNPALNQLLQRVATLTLDAYRHHEVPFEQVVEAAQPPRDPSRSPLRQVHFLLQNTPAATPDLDNLHVKSIDVASTTSQFDLAFVLHERPAGLQLTIEYNTKLFTAATIERLQDHYHMLLCAMVEQPETPIQSISLLTDEERQRLLHNWQQTSSHHPTTRLLHELIASTGSAAHTPHAFALYNLLLDLSTPRSAAELTPDKPHPGVRAYILDDLQQPVPQGLRGELYLAGEEITGAYMEMPDLPAERFMPDPFSEGTGQRMYRTGHSIYQRATGELVYVDGLDQQVKPRHIQLELGEIEQVLCSQPAIQQAVVLASEDQKGLAQLVAYIQPQANSPLDSALLRLALKRQLPAALLPTALVVIEAFPLTPTGEIDRQKLGSLDQPCLREDVSANVPQGPLEESLARIWTKILKLPTLERSDNFFAIGGHSLLAMQMLAALQEELHVTISIRQFFNASTIAELASSIEQAQAGPQAAAQMPDIPALLPIAHADEYPLSFAQQRLWFLDQLEGSSATYNIPIVLQFTGDLRLDVLQQCMNEIMRRHEVLRTTFPKTHFTPIQHIHLLAQAALEIINLPAGASSESQELLLKEIRKHVERPFDLAQGPLLRTHVLRLHQHKHIVIFVMHHIISDGWSLGVLAQELNALYNAFLAGKPSPLSELAIQYVDFVAWQRKYLQGALLAAHLDYWKQQLTDAPILQLPADHPRIVTQSLPGAHRATQWPLSLVERLQLFSLQEGVTIFMTLLTGFLILIAQESQQEDITVGTPIANRSHTALEPLVGFFVNTLALRTNLTGNPTARELLHRVRAVTLEAYDHQDVPFEQIVEAVHPNRQPGISPLFQVLFVLQNNATVDLALPNLEVQGLDMHTSTAKFDLTVALEIEKEHLNLSIEYNTQLFEPATIQRIQTHYHLILNQLSEHPEYTQADFSQHLSQSITQESTGEL